MTGNKEYYKAKLRYLFWVRLYDAMSINFPINGIFIIKDIWSGRHFYTETSIPIEL